MAGGKRIGLGGAALMLLAVGMAPVSGSAATNPLASIETRDADANGHIDRLVIGFRADPGRVAQTQVLVGGYTVAGVSQLGAVLTVTLSESRVYDTAVKPDVAFNDGRQWWLFLSSNAAYTDAAQPVLVSAVGRDFGRPNVFLDQPASGSPADSMVLRFSEPVSLNLNATPMQDPTKGSPVRTAADKALALEQALQLNGITMNGCGKDGDGVNGRNFPAPAADTAKATVADPIDFGTWPGGARVGATSGDQIIVTTKPGTSASTIGWVFAVRPVTTPTGVTLAKCTFSISGASAANILDAATNAASTRAAAVTILHAPGLLVSAPIVKDRSADGVIDEVALVYDHPVDASSATTDALSRLKIADAANPKTTATNLAVRSVTGSVLTVSFAAPAGWTSTTTPLVSYDAPAPCLGVALRIATPVGDKQCLAGFALRAIADTRRP